MHRLWRLFCRRCLARVQPAHAHPVHRLGIVLTIAGLGIALGTQPLVRALFAGASYGSTLYEMSAYGDEKVASLSVGGVTSDWYACNTYNCTSTPSYVSVTWNITDGLSTFEQIFGHHYGDAYCSPQTTSTTVNAGPSYSYGTSYAYFPSAACTVGYGVLWGLVSWDVRYR